MQNTGTGEGSERYLDQLNCNSFVGVCVCVCVCVCVKLKFSLANLRAQGSAMLFNEKIDCSVTGNRKIIGSSGVPQFCFHLLKDA